MSVDSGQTEGGYWGCWVCAHPSATANLVAVMLFQRSIIAGELHLCAEHEVEVSAELVRKDS